MMAVLYQQMLIKGGVIVTFLTETLGVNLVGPPLTENALLMIIIFDIWIGLGGSIVIWLGAMGRIPNDILEYGSLDGVG
ncbi:MAG: hypothetical protein WCU80_12140, partial [Paludibacteraceae bacterium]